MRTRLVGLILILVALASLAGLWFGTAASGAISPAAGEDALPPIRLVPEPDGRVRGSSSVLDLTKGMLLRGLKDVSISDNQPYDRIVHIVLLPEDKVRFAKLSRENVGRRVAVMAGGRVLMSAMTNEQSPGGELGAPTTRCKADALSVLQTYVVGPSWLVYAGMALAVLLLLVGLALLLRGDGRRPAPPENP